MKTVNFTLLTVALLILSTVNGIAQQQPEHRIEILDGEFFSIDRTHSTLKFNIGFMGLTDVEGTFDRYSATILYNENDMTKTEVIMRIDATSIDTGSDFRDRDLNSERFFHTEKYPNIIYKSSSIQPSESGYLMRGDLTIKGITKEVTIPMKHILKRTLDIGWENVRIGFSGKTAVNRNDFDIHGGDFWGLKALSEEVDIEFTILGTIRNLEVVGYRKGDKQSIGEVLEKELMKSNPEETVYTYEKLKKGYSESYNFSERELNLLVNKLYRRDNLEAASILCKLYIQEFPESTLAWTTMGEIYARLGNKKEAITHFKKAYQLDYDNDLAYLALKRLNQISQS